MDDFGPLFDSITKFLLAALLAGAVGLERERKGRGAGLRTHVLVCLGSTLAMVVSDLLAAEWASQGGQVWLDRGRIAAGVLTGIGFLGAGTIINVGGHNRGLTTAAMIWFVATLGIAIGLGYFLIATVATVMALALVIGLEKVEDRFPSQERFVLSLEMSQGLGKADEIAELIRSQGFVSILSGLKSREDGTNVEITFEIVGKVHPRIDRLVSAIQERFDGVGRIECGR